VLAKRNGEQTALQIAETRRNAQVAALFREYAAVAKE
jgi:hypothetical protein